MSNYVDVVILCEDRQQEVFARHFLTGCGVQPRRIRAKVCPSGKMSGEQFVRQEYPKEVKTYRSRSAYLKIGLTVVTDADVKSVAEKLRELEDALEGDGQGRRQSAERIAVFIPKRNIETWIHYLQGEVVNEVDAYSKLLGREGDCKPSVRQLAGKPRYNLTEDVPQSLREACHELQRLLPEKQCAEQAA